MTVPLYDYNAAHMEEEQT